MQSLLLPRDETEAALFRLCDRHADEIALEALKGFHHLPHGFVHEVLGSLPNGLIKRGGQAAGGADGDLVTLVIDPAVYGYLAAAAQYLELAIGRHGRPPR